MKYVVLVAGRSIEVAVEGGRVKVADREHAAHFAGLGGTPVRLLVLDGRTRELVALPGEAQGRWRIASGSDRFDVAVVDERQLALRAVLGKPAPVGLVGSVRAPMPGLVVRVEVEEGQRVTAGTGVVVVEAMKMENELRAVAPGVVRRIRVAAGERVEKGAVLVEIESLADGSELQSR